MQAIQTRYRTHTCGQLRKSDVGREVKLAGWVHSYRDHGGLVFIDLRDRDGLTQVVFDADECGKATHDEARRLRSEWVISISGRVGARGPGLENPKLATGEGARDFIVPARLAPGSFYALPQSPQLFKQLLMVAGCDKYMQIVRCFRDEDPRADRQAEFTQLDVEMSFIDRENIIQVMEGLLRRIWKENLGKDIPDPIPHMEYDEAMSRYGSDRPDLRYG